jgi:hypothetical protein
MRNNLTLMPILQILTLDPFDFTITCNILFDGYYNYGDARKYHLNQIQIQILAHIGSWSLLTFIVWSPL